MLYVVSIEQIGDRPFLGGKWRPSSFLPPVRSVPSSSLCLGNIRRAQLRPFRKRSRADSGARGGIDNMSLSHCKRDKEDEKINGLVGSPRTGRVNKSGFT